MRFGGVFCLSFFSSFLCCFGCILVRKKEIVKLLFRIISTWTQLIQTKHLGWIKD